MMKRELGRIAAAVVTSLIFNISGWGATEDADTEENQQKLPAPLNTISGNLPELEATGYFTITDARYARSWPLDEEALIWTVRVVRPITYRHTMLLLQQLGDVRFYRTTKHGLLEMYWTELYYSSWIAEGAVGREILGLDEQFEIWILLDEKQIDLLQRNLADTVVFRRLKR